MLLVYVEFKRVSEELEMNYEKFDVWTKKNHESFPIKLLNYAKIAEFNCAYPGYKLVKTKESAILFQKSFTLQKETMMEITLSCTCSWHSREGKKETSSEK